MRALVWLGLVACGEGSGPSPGTPWSTDDLVGAFEELHAPIYDVYGLGTDRDAVHGLLAERFVGEALTAEYVTHWRTLVAMDREDTGIVVTAVEYDTVEVVDDGLDGALRVDATWLVRGVVRHQRHKHPRINRYRAVYTLIETPAGLRIADTRMRDLARIRTEIPTDGLFDDRPGSGAEEGFMDPLEMFDAGLFEAADTDAEALP